MGQIRTNGVGNAAFAFNYWYPYNFKEKKVVINSNQPNDTSTYISPDNKCTLKIWPGKIVNFPLGAVDSLGKRIPLRAEDIIRAEQEVDRYIALIKSGKEVHVSQVKVLELCKGIDGYNFQIFLKGKLGSKNVIYKIELSELPVSGDLIFKHMLFSFDSEYAKEYEAVGIAIARDFGMR